MKEILIEILSEGLGNVPTRKPQVAGISTTESKRRPAGRAQFDPRLDTPIGNRQATDALKEAVRREAGGDPVMASILADTAMTTLPTQLSHGDSMGSGAPSFAPAIGQQEQFHGEVADVFGDAAASRDDGMSHWADLAFMQSKKTA